MLDMEPTQPILIAYDGSDGAKAAIEVAGRLFPGRRAVVLSVGHSLSAAFPSSLLAVSGGQAGTMYEHLEGEAEQQAATIAAEGVAAAQDAGLRATGRSVLCLGQTWPVITEVADEIDVEAIVVGSRGLSPVRSALLGSVANGVLHHTGRPVLVAPPA
jgi:nucleotide-binding universal stress UspA family protein